jgi:hypothetical protein
LKWSINQPHLERLSRVVPFRIPRFEANSAIPTRLVVLSGHMYP